MAFELTDAAAKLSSVTPRTERHGDDEVFAISLGFKLTTANTILDRLNPTLRDALYKAVEGQEQLPGVEATTPLLRTRAIDSLSLGACFEGWTLTVPHGIDEDEPIKLGNARVDKFKVTPHEGGSVDLTFRVGSNDIDATEAGLLCAKLGQEIDITLTAPVLASGAPVIDGSTEAFKADHPEAGDLFADGAADQHADDDSAGPGTGSSDDAPFGEAQTGENWPAEAGGADSEGGETDSSAAEFEAGAKAAIEKATGGRRGKRTRAVVE